MSVDQGAGADPGRHSPRDNSLPGVLAHSRTRVVFGSGSLREVGSITCAEGAKRVLLVTDPGLERAGHVARAVASLRDAGLSVTVFNGVAENPTTEHVAAGVSAARDADVDFLIGLGGGSSMDCAKGINFIHTNGGAMADYWGVNKAAKPMLGMIAIPTTAGTGSEAQSFALISDPATHQKMACGDSKAACRVAILDPDLTATQPPAVAAATAIDAVAHSIETAATTKRNDVSMEFTRQAWQRLDPSFETAMTDPSDGGARANMLLGAHLAGAAIEQSMLGAAHSCANPLTARLGITHGVAVGLLLPHVVRFNAQTGDNPYALLADSAETLACRIEAMLATAHLPRRLIECQVPEALLSTLAEDAAGQWTAQFNPRPVTADDLLQVYRAAFD